MASPYEQLSAKIDRAQKHIDDFNALADSFRQSNPCPVRIEMDEGLGEVRHYVDSVREIPVDAALIFGDAVQNLRASLDYLAYFLVERCGGNPDSQTGFPISKSSDEHPTTLSRKMPGIRNFLKETIDGLYPYQGAPNYLWMLHRLSIIDKHRLLLSVCHTNPGRTMTPREVDEFLQSRGISPNDPRGPFRYKLDQVIGGKLVPIKAGQKLLTAPISEANQNMSFMFDISLNESEFPIGTPMTLLLGFFRMEVNLVFGALAPFLG